MTDAVLFDGVRLEHPGGRVVLSGVDLRIPAGAFVGLLGANGAGKTTLMRAILGLLPPRAGSIALFGRRAARGSNLVGYMPQMRAALSVSLSGRALVSAAVNGRRWGTALPVASRRREVDRVLELVGAEALASRPLDELSGGERQRLLLAQCLIGDPRLLLLDEPLNSLDPSRQAELVALVRRLQREHGITVLFSAHELNPLLGALDQVLYLAGGHAALGSVDSVVTSETLSRLYGAPIEVIRSGGRIFVLPGAPGLERAA
ncbi:ATP-binding cassette domain-containing protein [Acetobacteraceae bacterium KSS8]|uniref:ATP-binding cassette domain-containing protein n=1 Tax=Endosaccharibacter trunci TaxID=2812733 RepID=A0ABT1W9E8_9PROT|nr:ATP-binding cassette domain-containing protein [Acetobacteraceae bacterium KSS8]